MMGQLWPPSVVGGWMESTRASYGVEAEAELEPELELDWPPMGAWQLLTFHRPSA